jgi:hypothetical protein
MTTQSFLSEAQVAQLANALAQKIDLPLTSERKEKKIFFKVVKAIDKYMSKYVADEILDALNSGGITISDIVAQSLKDNLTDVISDLVPLPFVPRAIKRRIIDLAIDILVRAMASATTLDEEIEAFLARA